MKFGIYLPPGQKEDEKFPVLFYLSGLTCTEQNFITKAGFQKYAAQYKIIVVSPDTSPSKFNSYNVKPINLKEIVNFFVTGIIQFRNL